jgi:hypothetical protein
MAALLENLCRYQDEGESFVESIITGDERWVYKFTPGSKRNSVTWKRPYSPTAKKKIRIEPSAIKTMASVFWDCEDLLCEFLPPKTTINSNKYCKALEKLREAIKRKRPGRLTAGVRLLHDGGKFCSIHHIVLIWHHQICTFGSFKNFLSVKRFEDQNVLQKTIVRYFTSLGRGTLP